MQRVINVSGSSLKKWLFCSDTIPIPLNRPLLPDTFENEDLRGYQFGKFAATYFQGQATAEYIKRPLRISLLPHNDATGQLVSKYSIRN